MPMRTVVVARLRNVSNSIHHGMLDEDYGAVENSKRRGLGIK